jgi:hypothetical protein
MLAHHLVAFGLACLTLALLLCIGAALGLWPLP